jgi:glycosyltransferase involved in cell wall biosynthesis
MNKKINIAYLRGKISWDRPGLFDKTLIKSLLEKANIDLYIENPINTNYEEFINPNYGDFNSYKFKTTIPTFLSSIKIFLKIKLIQKKYDYILTDSTFFNIANAMFNSKKSILLILTPERSFYDLYYFRLNNKNLIKKIISKFWIYPHRAIDQYFIKKTKAKIISISNISSKRIFSYYQKYSNVLYPIAADRSKITMEKIKIPFKKYFLVVNRFVPEKRIEIVINNFKKIKNKNLIIVGWEGDKKYKEMLFNITKNNKNIIILEKVKDSNLKWLYKNCEAVIQTNHDEDFGMVPLESMEEGKPVIAVAEGGFCETIINNFNGKLIIQPYDINLNKEIINFDIKKFNQERIKKYVKKKFNYQSFKNTIWSYILNE